MKGLCQQDLPISQAGSPNGEALPRIEAKVALRFCSKNFAFHVDSGTGERTVSHRISFFQL